MREVNLKQAEFAELSAEILGQGGSFCFKARGSSMYPFIRDGDILTVQSVQAAALEVGDVAFYRAAGDRLVVHRVVDRQVKDGQVVIMTRGDASADDEQVQLEQVLGRVVSIKRGENAIRLNQGLWRSVALFWINLRPIGRPVFQLAGMIKYITARVLCRLQGLRFYRVLARRLISKKFLLRIATAGDAHDLSRLYGYGRFPELGDPIRNFAEQLESLKGCGYALVASVRGRIVGAAIVRQFPESESLYPDWWLFGMFVRTRHRGAGIGEGLVRMAMEKAVEEGATKMNLMLFEQDRAAVNLYRKMGFRTASVAGLDGQLLEEVQQGSPRRIIMSRPLGVAQK